MLQAALIEDEQNTREYLSYRIKEAFHQFQEEIEIFEYENADRFLQRLTIAAHYDILFLDIEMPGMDGITLAGEIRKILPHALIIFISSQEQLVFKSLEVQPFRFLRKQLFDKEILQIVPDIQNKVRKNHQHMIYLTESSTGDIYSFDSFELLYVEAQRKDCRLKTFEKDTLIRSTINNMKEKLEPWGFIQCHRSYLVNWRAIYQITKSEVILINNERIPLSRGLSAQVHSQFIRIVQKEGH